MLKEKVKELAMQKGVQTIGVASAERLNAEAPPGYRPEDNLPGTNSIIVYLLPWPQPLTERLPESRAVYSRIMLTINNISDALGWEMALLFQEQGFQAYPIPNSDPYNLQDLMGYFSHKHAAFEAGLGHFGLNNLLLTPRYGPRQRFGSVLTTAKLECDKPFEGDLCTPWHEKCQYACMTGCPVDAYPKQYELTRRLKQEGVSIDKVACSYYQDRGLPRMGRNGFTYRCGLCITNCPAGKLELI